MPSDGTELSAGHAARHDEVPAEGARTAPVALRMPAPTSLSIVVPLFEEEANVALLVQRIHDALATSPWPWELVAVDDGSTDATLAELVRARERHGDHVRIIAFRRNYGQTAAMSAGIDAARGELIATLDGDLQNDPNDVLHLAERLRDDDLDLVAGWRQRRQDPFLSRRLPSQIANGLIGRLTGVRLHDYGCTLKVFRAAVLKQVRLFGEMHRFIPAWLVMVTPVSRIAELPVNHAPRLHGRSKYGLWRTVHVLLDLLVVVFFQRFQARPGHFFGLLGMIIGGLGAVGLAWLAIVKFVLGEAIGGRPLLLVAIMCVLGGVQLVTTGVLAEILLRSGPAHDGNAGYVLDPRFTGDVAGWKRP